MKQQISGVLKTDGYSFSLELPVQGQYDIQSRQQNLTLDWCQQGGLNTPCNRGNSGMSKPTVLFLNAVLTTFLQGKERNMAPILWERNICQDRQRTHGHVGWHQLRMSSPSFSHKPLARLKVLVWIVRSLKASIPQRESSFFRAVLDEPLGEKGCPSRLMIRGQLET